MSEYHVAEVIFKDEGVLVQSIKDMGYEVEVHDEAVKIGFGRGTHNAHIVVKRNQFNGMGDVGFERTEKGFVVHADDYDIGQHGSRFGLTNLNKKYVENQLKKYCGTTSACNIHSREEKNNGQLEIQLRIGM